MGSMAEKELFGISEQLNDTISRQVAIKAADSIIERDTSGNNDVVKAMTAWKEYIKALPSAQPERKKGEWSDGYRWQRCSLCKQTGKKSWNYCPNCGADMRGEQDGSNKD